MRWGALKELAILIAIFAAVWAGFSYYNYDKIENLFSISLEKEAELSEFMTKHLMTDFEFIHDQSLDSSIQIITNRLLSNLDSPQYAYKFHIINEPEANAFTTLDGNIYIFSGLIDEVSSAEELALILAHEIGHAENKHVVEKLIKTIGIEALFSIMTGGDPVLISEISKITLSTSFDRLNEEEADDFALKLAYDSKINPRRLAQFFLKMKAKDQSALQEKLAFISTHPMSNDRIKKSSDFAISDDFEEVSIPLDWEVVKEYLN
ncbi:Peptidase family M48 [Reichenbachiella faecimaris]|uniref:Peptidase family M48 n=1 Tax=Reichenbachiella faecimaris TaxID=692418 RepID=A0A1W2GQ00_REIFA|nr:M48 family metallopeptidase [Reichenbachiella faecimaris]SMD38671.1 Peptidase family M48 [Reichenbachiella faecimaris]